MESNNLQSNQKLVTNPKECNTQQNELEPNPERFDQYVEINDDQGELIGFFIIEKNKKIIFYFDQFGGWYDEGKNYYDCNGDYIEIAPQNSEFKAPIIEYLEDEEDENQEDSVEDFIIPKNNHYSSENGGYIRIFQLKLKICFIINLY
ncbi:hypothetical protein PPERSA_03495 [Pseudocohnilembus persalinus]|uniref:Uncharacterized protein n=1 Tax=Pseudocohnilembus persalinus TaxID=266149 RepID=A0A0V0QBU2_PSEPJ|nr:hypothetical protein PPERSA_03495 [Pseudocohnilembus persalinus]|eukprot:KRW99694.1 hypothetical protein PPERSA_03495 [Pseudocohnilembus persalinus]